MRTLAAFAVLMLVTGCQAPPAEMTEAEIAQIKAEVLSMGDQWLAAVNDVDPDGFLDLFDPAGTHATDGYHYANYEDWVAWVERLFSTWQDVNWAWAATPSSSPSSSMAPRPSTGGSGRTFTSPSTPSASCVFSSPW